MISDDKLQFVFHRNKIEWINAPEYCVYELLCVFVNVELQYIVNKS
jgi:hypothetical protein